MNDERSANAIDRRIGQRLKARRLEMGISQEKLADLLGVTFQQIQKYEKGVNRVAASRLFDIAAALDVPIAHFYDGLTLTGHAGVAEEGLEDLIYDTLATPDGLELMRLYGAIRNPRVKRRVLELIRVMAEDAAEADQDGPPSAEA